MKSFSKYAAVIFLVVAATLIGEVVRLHLSPSNMVMLYLLAVVLAALKLGLRPAIVTAALGVFAFDFFFVPPRFSLTVADKEYLVTFLALFLVGLVISSLVAKARERAAELAEREAETAALYRLSRDIASAPDRQAVYSAIVRNAAECFSAEAAILLPEQNGLRLAAKTGGMSLSPADMEVAEWSFKSLRKGGSSTSSFAGAAIISLPLVAMGGCEAVLALASSGRTPFQEDFRLTRFIEGFSLQLKMALNRIELSRQAEEAQLLKARESLERALLNSVSHDLRTPLSIVTGVLSSLRDKGISLSDPDREELLATACSEAERLNRFVGNLLDMTRIESGAIRLKREPADIQDLVGCALAALEPRIGPRAIRFTMEPDLPLVPMDMVLMTQVLVNLLDNAHKYSPAASAIDVAARIEKGWLLIEVVDQGPGVPEQDLKRVFDKFYRIPVPEGAGGTGLGLSICKGIVEAHGGSILAGNRVGGGLRVEIRLPLAAGEGR